MASNSPMKTPGRPQSVQDLVMGATRSISMDSLATVAGNGLTEEISPCNVIDILSAVLLVLQVYEVNPAIVIQTFSQIFFWIASELFNRILTRKKYLCRTKAVQIRMNISVLEDWVRANGLPVKTATTHLVSVMQLLQWLQCSSQIKDFDTLIGTMQNMKAINPLQMRRAVRDYRFEVNEGKMTEECVQYLAQLQKDWERRKVQAIVQASEEETRRKESDGFTLSDQTVDGATTIDALFDGTVALVDFIPQSAPECLGELIDSRFMLPFLLPRDNVYLVATPPADTAYQKISPQPALISDGSSHSRAPSRSSFSSSRPMGWTVPSSRKLREIPPDFFTWLKDRKAEVRHNKHARQKETPAIVNGLLGPLRKEIHPPRQPIAPAAATKIDLLPAVTEVERSPPAISSCYLSQSNGFPHPGLQTSPSLELLRLRGSRVPFKAIEEPSHSRTDSYELKIRCPEKSLQPPLSVTVDLPSCPPPSAPQSETAARSSHQLVTDQQPKIRLVTHVQSK